MGRLAISLLYLSLLFSCDLLKKKENESVAEGKGKPLARVYTKYLYPGDIEGIMGESYSKEDSAALVQRYIDSWILKQLMLLKAEARVDETDAEIQRKILDCRNTLLIHEFEKEYLEKSLDTALTEDDLKNYYETNIDHFQLKQNIIKGTFIKIPKDAPRVEKVKTWIHLNRDKDKELKSYCVRFASHYILGDTIWLNFDELTKNTPFATITDKADFLEKNRYSEKSDNHYLYFLKIEDYKISKQVSPFEFVKDQIRNTLLNRRRIDLVNELKLNIYKEAENNEEFEIYSEK